MTRCVGTALVEELDRRLLVQLRDGRKILGILRCSNAAFQHHTGPVSRTAVYLTGKQSACSGLFLALPKSGLYTSQHHLTLPA